MCVSGQTIPSPKSLSAPVDTVGTIAKSLPAATEAAGSPTTNASPTNAPTTSLPRPAALSANQANANQMLAMIRQMMGVAA